MTSNRKQITTTMDNTAPIIDLVDCPDVAPEISNVTTGPPTTIAFQNKGNIVGMYRLNLIELPETIFVETKFITKTAAVLGKYENLYCFGENKGVVEFKKVHTKATKSSAKSTVTVSMKPTHSLAVSTSNFKPTSGIGAIITPITPQTTVATTEMNLSTTKNINLRQNVQISTKPVYTNANLITTATSNPNGLLLNNISCNVAQLQPIRKQKCNNKDAETMTEAKIPSRDRGQQTDDIFPKTRSLAIQCNLYDEIEKDSEEDEIVAEDFIENSIGQEEEKEQFRDFIFGNSILYQNGLRECIICGEVTKTFTHLLRHMSVHWGPKVLCFKCGKQLDHKSLLKKHYCSATKKHRTFRLRCPYFRCSTVTISLLELYDHLNEHSNFKMYACNACSKSFCTAGEFQRHLLLRAKCYTSAKRPPLQLYGLDSSSDRKYRVRVFTLHTKRKGTHLMKTFLSRRRSITYNCPICLKKYINRFTFKLHTQKCLNWYKERMAHINLRRLN
uniref:C2H2-type domain-containing protein n=1 Tax=Glossina brevipalpis TaxID=37001 RepID=A0A1A9WC03_9MUSC